MRAERFSAGGLGLEGTPFAWSGYPKHITRITMRPDYTAADYVSSRPVLPLISPEASDETSHSRRHGGSPARVTFCFAWRFGLEAFLAGGAPESTGLDIDSHR